MREMTERSGFPKTGDMMSVIRFVCETPTGDRDRIYIGPVKEKVGLFNFCLFPQAVTTLPEQAEILRAAEAVAKLAAPDSARKEAVSTTLFVGGRTEDGSHTPDAPAPATPGGVRGA